MKRLLASIFLLTAASISFATTTVPVQLLNPTGSSSGQAIVSTGASSAPTWGGVGVNGIAAISANTVLANVTSSSASPTAFAMPSCSASGGTLQYTSGTGFTCVANAFASPPTTGYGSATPEPVAATTISATGLITPTSTIGIKGTTTNDSPAAGSIGEQPSAGPTTTGNLTTGTPTNITSVSLTAGNWAVTGLCAWAPSSTTLTAEQCGISTTSATFGSFGTTSSLFISGGTTSGSGIPAPTVYLKLSGTTTVYLVTQVTISSGSTVTATGLINALRIR